MLLRTLFFVCSLIYVHASITEYIDEIDKKRFCGELKKGFVKPNKTDFSSIYYAANSFINLKEPIENVFSKEACTHLDVNFKDVVNSEGTFHAVSTWLLLNCAAVLSKKSKLYTPETIKNLKAKLEGQDSTVADIRYALESLTLVGEPIPNTNNVVKLLQKKLKSDDSLLTLGHALHAGALLGTSGQFVGQYVEDIIVQADEVGGHILQWEGGLSVTGLLLTGLFRLPQPQSPLTQIQADKFITYLLTRKTATNLKGINILIESLLSISKSKVAPMCVTFVDSLQVTIDQPDLKIRISDLFGQPLSTPPTNVIAQSATRVVDDVVVLSKQALTPGKDKREFILSLKLSPGQYRIVLVIDQERTVTPPVKVLGSVSLQWLEAGLGDTDGTTAPQLTKLHYPSKLTNILIADANQQLLVRFTLSQTVHQAFLCLSNGNEEIIFVAEQDSNKVYKVDINIATKLRISGTFELQLILGDSLISNPIKWNFGSVKINLKTNDSSKPVFKGLLPEIVHQFRPAEKRPPQTVSTLFTALAAAPLLLLLILWCKLRINFSNFTIDALPFHIGLGGIFGLFVLFWLKLDMFTTCGWLIPVGGFTFLTGHHILNKLANKIK